MDPQKDSELFYIAREALKSPLPEPWKPCRRKGVEEIFYVNLETGEIVFDHPADEYYREYYLQEKDKLEKSKKCIYIVYIILII